MDHNVLQFLYIYNGHYNELRNERINFRFLDLRIELCAIWQYWPSFIVGTHRLLCGHVLNIQ